MSHHDTDLEIWKPVLGYEGYYEVSNFGRVKSFWRGAPKILKPSENHEFGYLSVNLHHPEISGYKTRLIQHLVLEAFQGPRPAPEMVCRHRDGNPKNNRNDNLCWGTQAENLADRVEHGTANRGSRQGLAVLDEGKVKRIKELLKTGIVQRRIAEEFGVSYATITMIKKGQVWGWL